MNTCLRLLKDKKKIDKMCTNLCLDYKGVFGGGRSILASVRHVKTSTFYIQWILDYIGNESSLKGINWGYNDDICVSEI